MECDQGLQTADEYRRSEYCFTESVKMELEFLKNEPAFLRENAKTFIRRAASALFGFLAPSGHEQPRTSFDHDWLARAYEGQGGAYDQP